MSFWSVGHVAPACQEAELKKLCNDQKVTSLTGLEGMPVVRLAAFSYVFVTSRCAFAEEPLLAASRAAAHLGVVPSADQHVQVGTVGRGFQLAGQELQRLSHMQAMQVHYLPPSHLQDALRQSATMQRDSVQTPTNLLVNTHGP